MVLYCLLAFGIAVWKAGEIKFAQLMAGMFGALLIPYAFSAFFSLQGLGGHRGYLLLPLILSFGCDTFAYFTGLAIGKRKLAPPSNPQNPQQGRQRWRHEQHTVKPVQYPTVGEENLTIILGLYRNDAVAQPTICRDIWAVERIWKRSC